MVEKRKPLQHGSLRPGRVRDEAEVRCIADEVFDVFGEYGSWLPGYITHPGVWSFVFEVNGELAGFAMLGVLEPDAPGDGRIGDLLAIAVRSRYQGRGVGTKLLARVVDEARELKETMDLEEVRLTVAEPNRDAQRLFAKFGFVALAGDHGYYDKGQRALRLRLVL